MPKSSDIDLQKKILFIDDDETAHLIFKVLISKVAPDIKFRTFPNAIEAFKQLPVEQDTNSVIVLDINMPRMSGWDFLIEMNKIGFKCPVYMLTSSNDHRDRLRVAEFPLIQGYFVKPLRLAQVELVIQEHFKV